MYKKLLSFILSTVLLSSFFSIQAEMVSTVQVESEVDEELISCEATIEDDFKIGEVLVCIKQGYSEVNKIWTAADFPELVNIEKIEDLTYADTADAVEIYNFTENFHQLLVITITDSTKEAVLLAISCLQQNEKLLFAEPNYIIEIDVPISSQENGIALANNLSINNFERFQEYTNDPLLLNQDGIFVHNVDKVWNAFTTGSTDIQVGILDGGVYRHSDLQANLSYGYDCTQLDSNGNIISALDTNYTYYINHGTGVASIVGARGNNDTGMSGVCQKVSIVPFIITRNGSSDSRYVAQAILKANVQNVPILNISFAYGAMNERIATLAASMYSGLIVVSAGNSGKEITATSYHAPIFDLDNVIVVGGLEWYDSNDDGKKEVFLWDDSEGGNVENDKSNYSSTYVDIMALGNNAYACDSPLEGGQYKRWGGTSISAPFVAGVAALLLSYDSTLTTAQVKQYILTGAKTSSNLTDYCVNGRYLDAYGAFLAMMNDSPISMEMQVKQIQPTAQTGEIGVYKFEIYHLEPYVRLTEIVIPEDVKENMYALDVEVTSDLITMSMYIAAGTLPDDTPLLLVRYITYDTVAYGKAYMCLNSGTHINEDGDFVVANVPYEHYVLGDANLDNVVGATDLLRIQQHINGSITLNDMQKAAVDIDKDGIVNMTDYLRISQYISGTLKSLC